MTTLSTTRFFLIRHGETLANREFRYIGGSYDNILSPLGRRQATLLADALAPMPVAAVYSSPLQRASSTAEPIAARHHLDVQLVEVLREVQFGQWEGLTRAEVIARSSHDAQLLLAWESDPTVAPPDGESMEMVLARAHLAITELSLAHPGQTIVLVSHVVTIKVLLCLALGASLSSASHLFLDPATINVLDWQQPRPLVRLLNSHAHLGWEQARWMSHL